jgi:hypothetical protein
LLPSIAKTAIDAGDAFENQEGAKRTTKVGELRDRIAQVLDMLAFMSFSENDSTTSVPSIVPPTLSIPSEKPMGVALRPMESLAAEPIQPASDQSRKRCASELEGEHRNVKAMKREPQDDILLSLTTKEVNHLPAAATTFAVPPVAPPVVFPVIQSLMPQSGPLSRPPTPPSVFAAHNSFTTIKQQTPLMGTSFPTFVAGPTSMPMTSLSLPTNVIPPTFPSLHHSWSDPTTTRHQHSLSAGSVTGLVNQPSMPTTHLNTLSPSIPLPTVPQSTTVPVKTTTSIIGSPIGGMSRSESINGTTLKNPYASFVYQDGYSNSSAWHPKISSSSSRSGQSSWYMGSEPLNTLRKSSLDFTGSIPGISHDSPPSDDDDDDSDSDSDDSHGKAVIHRVRGSIQWVMLLSDTWFL